MHAESKAEFTEKAHTRSGGLVPGRVPAPAVVPQPLRRAGSSRVSYLTDEQKDALNRKYGKISPPTAAEMSEVVASGANCKMQ
eukprot:scaffold11052_cov48-Tisochrysis_lutea.AAC.1